MSVLGGNPLLIAGDDQYQISRSVRLRSSASAYFNRTPASAGNRKTWTWSGWVKRGALGAAQDIFSQYSGSVSDFEKFNLRFASSDKINIDAYSFNFLISTQVFRDPSAWYHIVFAFDTTQATANNRTRLYVNGTEVTAFDTRNNPSLNTDYGVNMANTHRIGSNSVSLGAYFDGYLTEVNFIDGQALTPSSFGETDVITGVWKPKKYAGTYGTNGFYLNFSDNSAATAAAIGKDYSGNGNNWTPNNISVTAGVTYDSMIDVPTMYADGGNGRGNYAVINPICRNPTYAAPANGNLSYAGGTTAINSTAISTMSMVSGKWYCEATAPSANMMVGILRNTASAINSVQATQLYLGQIADGYAYYGATGNKWNSNSSSAYGASFTTNDVIGIAYDADAGTVSFYKNGVSQGNAYTGLTGEFFFAFTEGSAAVIQVNFGQRPFSYTPPTGFKALNTQNLPDATIRAGNKFFDATTYTGNGGTLSVTNSGGFQPDFVWAKCRSSPSDHALYDSVRGIYQDLASSTTGAETTQTTGLIAFNANGFTTGAYSKLNANATTYVGWQWKESAAAGFDIVTYTGTGVARTVAHGLGVKPSLIIIKPRSAANPWSVYHASVGATKYLLLNATDAGATNATFMNNTEPTSSVFSLGSGTYVNTNGVTHVAYLFAEVAGFSKFGSYTGNGSADGPFVYCGFRPKFVMVKRTDAVSSWNMIDTSRSAYNVTGNLLNANLSDAEYAQPPYMDFVSNGFKVRTTDAGQATGNENQSGGTYIYAAFAENPFKNSLAR